VHTFASVSVPREAKDVFTEGLVRLGQQRNNVSPQRPFWWRVQKFRNVFYQVVHVPTTRHTHSVWAGRGRSGKTERSGNKSERIARRG